MTILTVKSGDVQLTLIPGKDVALVSENGTERRIEVTRWLFRDNLPPVPLVALNGHSETEVAAAVMAALR